MITDAIPPENPCQSALTQLESAAALMNLDPAALELLRNPLRELHLSLPVRMDDGTTRVFRGFRVQHNDARGPNKGGIRFHPQETIDTVRALATWMTLKTALLDLPLGGGKGGVICDPKTLSAGELERLSRAYIRQAAALLGPGKDVPAPDVYTSPQIMAWMADEYSMLQGHYTPGVITGKPTAIGGSAGRGDATARGGIYCVRQAAGLFGIGLTGARVAIQGYGNAGSAAHKLARELLQMKVVAVSDSKGGIHNPEGLDHQRLGEWKKKTGSVTGFPGASAIKGEELLQLEVDVLIPAALESVITAANAPNIRSRIVAELANGPTTPEADIILQERAVHVIPDILCNSGGVTVSWLEMVQNASGYYWKEDEVLLRLEEKMTTAFHAVQAATLSYQTTSRRAACILAIGRVAEAMKLRGWY
ncbi:MAG: Glu/Leu/Phe/Val dehydrogenase [Chlorobiaceae bacterium]